MIATLTDQSQATDSLARRLQDLERRNEHLSTQVGRMKAVISAILILTGVGVLGIFAPATRAGGADDPAPKIVRASAFVIVDANGKERGSFGYNDTEQAAVLNLEPDKSGRINFGIGRDYLGLRMTHGKNDINMGYTPRGGTYFEMLDKDGKSIFAQRRP
jgi:hypothetical protein